MLVSPPSYDHIADQGTYQPYRATGSSDRRSLHGLLSATSSALAAGAPVDFSRSKRIFPSGQAECLFTDEERPPFNPNPPKDSEPTAKKTSSTFFSYVKAAEQMNAVALVALVALTFLRDLLVHDPDTKGAWKILASVGLAIAAVILVTAHIAETIVRSILLMIVHPIARVTGIEMLARFRTNHLMLSPILFAPGVMVGLEVIFASFKFKTTVLAHHIAGRAIPDALHFLLAKLETVQPLIRNEKLDQLIARKPALLEGIKLLTPMIRNGGLDDPRVKERLATLDQTANV